MHEQNDFYRMQIKNCEDKALQTMQFVAWIIGHARLSPHGHS
jgi:hypothetical protein